MSAANERLLLGRKMTDGLLHGTAAQLIAAGVAKSGCSQLISGATRLHAGTPKGAIRVNTEKRGAKGRFRGIRSHPRTVKALKARQEIDSRAAQLQKLTASLPHSADQFRASALDKIGSVVFFMVQRLNTIGAGYRFDRASRARIQEAMDALMHELQNARAVFDSAVRESVIAHETAGMHSRDESFLRFLNQAQGSSRANWHARQQPES